MLFTNKYVDEFIKEHPIDTCGAITKYSMIVEEFDDGDTGIVVNVPYWPNNDSVAAGVLKFVLDAVRGGASVYPESDNGYYFRVYFYITVCDPD